MKKLLFAMAVAAFAACANAAYILRWDTGTVYAPAAGGEGIDLGTALEGDPSVVAQLYLGTGYSGGALTGSIDLGTGATASGTDDYGLASASTASILDAGTYYGYMTVTSGDSTLTSEVFSFEIPTGYAGESFSISAGDGGYHIDAVTGSLDDDLGAFPTTGWAKSGGGGGGGTIPEPTSGLLLVVGGAMLALRRKR